MVYLFLTTLMILKPTVEKNRTVAAGYTPSEGHICAVVTENPKTLQSTEENGTYHIS